MPAKAFDGFGFFEFYRGDTRTYHRVPVPDIITAIDAGNSIEDPSALNVRHPAWPGVDKREIELEILARRQHAIEDALRRGQEKKAREERDPAGGPRSRPTSSKNTAPWKRR